MVGDVEPITRRAMLSLAGVTLVWGASFLVMKEGADVLRRVSGGEFPHAPLCYLMLRFGLAFPAGLLMFRVDPRKILLSDWRRGALLALPMIAGFVLQLYGLENTSPAISAFLTSLYVVFTPLLVLVIQRTRMELRLGVGVGLALVGVALLTRPWNGSLGAGEVFSILCAFFFAVHILAIDHLTREGREVEITLAMIGVTAFLIAIPLPFLAGTELLTDTGFWWEVFRDPWIWAGLTGLSLLGTVWVLWALNRYQKALSPTRAAVLYTLEPLWALVFSAMAGRESLDIWFVCGGLTILAGNMWIEVRPRAPG